LRDWEKQGVVKAFYAYSRAKERSKGAKYVQDRLWEERQEILDVFEKKEAKIFICGSANVGEGVMATFKRMYTERAEKSGKKVTDEEVEVWFQNIKAQERYASDIFV
jgi:cytochrome P450/NADPH-cytochrome P450 reductase